MKMIESKTLKRDYVTYGWEGNELEIVEFPPEMAIYGLFLQGKFAEQYPDRILAEQCIDTLEANRNGEMMMLIEPMWNLCVNEIKSLKKKLQGNLIFEEGKICHQVVVNN